MAEDIEYRWRFPITDDEVNDLTRSYGGHAEPGWWDRIRPHSLGWATARLPDGTAVGFVNVAWDGGDHAFLLDPKTRRDHQRRGIGTGLVRLAVEQARRAGCECCTSTSRSGWPTSTSGLAASSLRGPG